MGPVAALPCPALGLDGSRKCYFHRALHALPTGWWHLSPLFSLAGGAGSLVPAMEKTLTGLNLISSSFLKCSLMLRLAGFVEWWWCIDLLFPFSIFFLFSSPTPSPCAVVMFILSLVSSLLRGPRFGNLAFLGSCSIPQSLQLPSSRLLHLLLMQRPELDATC